MESKIYGYVRVSSTDQNEDRQLMAMNKVNVPEKNIYMDKLSGKDFIDRFLLMETFTP